MTNEQFLSTFKKHLNVGGTPREEIIAELKSHLEEEGAEKLGDPKALARKSNRVHLGFFSSALRICISFEAIVLLFDVILPWLLITTGWVTGGTQHFINIPAIWTIAEITTYISTAAFIYFSYHAEKFHQRIVLVFGLVGIIVLGYVSSTFIGILTRYFQTYNISGDPASAWEIIQMTISYTPILYLTLALAIFFISSGKRALFPKHQWLDIPIAGIILTASVLYVFPYIWNVITEFHYTEYMYYASLPYFDHKNIIALGFGLLGATIEIARIHLNKNTTSE